MATTTERTKRAKLHRGNGRLLDLRQAEAYSGLSYWTLYDLIAKGTLPAVRPPGLRRIFLDKRDLERAIEAWKEVAS